MFSLIMNYRFRINLLVGLFGAAAILTSCDDDPPLPDNIVQFESATLGFNATEEDLAISISLSRALSESATLTIAVAGNNATYGTDFTTEPAASAGTLTLTVAQNATAASFNVQKEAGALFDGDEKVIFTIQSATGGLVIGENETLELSFAEIVATQATMNPNVGGLQQPNRVFIDLSANRQTVRNRSDWDLGFSSEANEFRVVLNTASSMLAYPLDKTSLTEVTAQDTLVLGSRLDTDAIFSAIILDTPPAWVTGAVAWMDDPTGDLSKTAIDEISATASENKVYIVNRGKNPNGTDRGWKKVRITRNGNGYTVEHADIASTTIQTIQVRKNADFRFNYVNFTANNVVEVEPKKDEWDIAFTVFTNTFPLNPMNPALGVIPYVFQDVVIQNRYEVETAMVLNSAVTYENFGVSNLSGLNYNSSQVAIGSGWRSIMPQTGELSLRTDRFYIIKDADDNVHKLRFTAITQDGERGRPRIEYALVQRGN